MKKALSVAALALSSSVLLAACGQDSIKEVIPPPPATAPAETPEPAGEVTPEADSPDALGSLDVSSEPVEVIEVKVGEPFVVPFPGGEQFTINYLDEDREASGEPLVKVIEFSADPDEGIKEWRETFGEDFEQSGVPMEATAEGTSFVVLQTAGDDLLYQVVATN
jgi:hypothetical protein